MQVMLIGDPAKNSWEPFDHERFADARSKGVRVEIATDCSVMEDGSEFPIGQPREADQSSKDDCDINVIVGRFVKTGVLPSDFRDGFYGDVSEMPDYRTALDTVSRAQILFMALPAKVRARFDNDPAVFLDEVSKPENADEMRELGLFPKLVVPIDRKAPVGEKEAPDSAKVEEPAKK